MIQLPLLLPLVISGVVGALWRERQKNKLRRLPDLLQDNTDKVPSITLAPPSSHSIFDDCVEVDHYQRTSFYALALSASATWFYAPVIWACIPLLSYDSYYLIKTVKHSNKKNHKSALTVFEFASLSGSMITGHLMLASASFVLSFSIRKMLLQAGNIAQIGLNQVSNLELMKVWVLRNDIEMEITVSELCPEDIIVVQAGETIIIEAVVLKGSGLVQQFSLQNKVKLIDKQKGDKVFPFTRLESGSLLLQKP